MNTLYRLYLLLLFGAAFALLSGCGSSSPSTNEGNLAHLYLEGATALNPQISLHHLNMDSSRVDFGLQRAELLYMKGSNDQQFQAGVAVIYQLVKTNGEIVDSGRVALADRKAAEDQGELRSSFYVHRHGLAEALKLQILFRDLNRKYDSYHEKMLRHEQMASRQYFEWRDLNGHLQFGNVLNGINGFRLRYLPKDTLLYVRYYQRDFPIATPPYTRVNDDSFDFNEDSLFLISTLDTLYFPQTGIYHIQIDTALDAGFTLFRFETGFPYVLNQQQLGPPMRYITTKEEYAQLTKVSTADSLKLAADVFWLDAAGSIERGQELVAAYFGRVESANRNFSSYLEGWKTDRGLMYIIYGPPSEVYRNQQSETWIYGDRNSSLSYIFNFVKVENPFTDNDFALNRLSEYRYGWGQAVGAWRNGRVYGTKDIQREQNARDAQLRQQRASPTVWY